MPGSVTELVDLLDLEEIEVGLFRGRQPKTALQRVFGGQVLAQSPGGGVADGAGRPAAALDARLLHPSRPDRPADRVRRGEPARRPLVLRAAGRGAAGRLGDLLRVLVVPHPRGGRRARRRGADRLPAPEDCPTLSEVLSTASGRPASVWEQEWGALGGPLHRRLAATERLPDRPGAPRAGPGLDPYVGAAGGRPPAAPERPRVRQRPDPALGQHHAARADHRPERPGRLDRPRDVVPPAVPGRPAGCSTTRCRRRRPARWGCPPRGCSRTASWSARWRRRV